MAKNHYTLAVVIGVSILGASLLACGGDGDAAGPDAEPPGADADAPDAEIADAAAPDAAIRTLTGVAHNRHVTAAGEVVEPEDLSDVEIAALFGPSFTEFPGVGLADGTFSIPDVPDGPYLLQVGDYYIALEADSVDLSADELGRPDAAEATISPTDLVFDVTNLSPWQDGDHLALFGPDNGSIEFFMELSATSGIPQPGETELTALTFDLSLADDPILFDEAAGDTALLTQLSTATDGTHSFQTARRVFAPSAFTVADGGSANLTGAFTDIAQTQTLEFSWDRAAFDAALRAQVPPADPQQPAFSSLVVHTLPEADTRGFYSNSADVLMFRPGFGTDTSTVTGAWAYGDPYPAEWTQMVDTRYITFRFVQLPNTTARAVFSGLLANRLRSAVTPGAPLVPIVGPVAGLQVSGLDAYGTLSAIGETPTISWTAPALGVADGYRVFVMHAFDSAGATEIEAIATLDTTDTSITIPPGIIASGQTYLFEVDALSRPGVDLRATPHRRNLPTGLAFAATSLATP